MSGTLELFADVLFSHVATESDRYWLHEDYSTGLKGRAPRALVDQFAAHRHRKPGFYLAHFGISDRHEFISSFFEERAVFVELVRAGEGVARDFISLFQDACFDCVRRRKTRVDLRSVREVAREWYAKEKAVNLAESQSAVLDRIVAEVVGRHKARSFLFDKAFEESEMIRSLFDLRLVHLIKRGFMPPDEQGRKFNIYTLDYGTYVDALGTDRAPTGDFSGDHRPGDTGVVVPFHDERAIKRIIIPHELLSWTPPASDTSVKEPGPGSG